MTARPRVALAAAMLLGWGGARADGAGASTNRPEIPTSPRIDSTFGRFPLYFIENRGQLDGRVSYYLPGRTSTYFTSKGITYAFTKPAGSSRLRSAASEKPLAVLSSSREIPEPPEAKRWAVAIDLVGARQDLRPEGAELNPTIVSYFKGPKEQWKVALPTYTSLLYRDVWPGIDLEYTGKSGQMKYTFVVQPGADPRAIKMRYRGAASVRVDATGELLVQTPLGGMRDQAPVVYQERDGCRDEVAARHALQREGAGYVASFQVGPYDHRRPLVIDPVVLAYCGYIGGTDLESAMAMAVDSTGRSYVTGWVYSSDFPVSVGPDLSYGGTQDAFVTRVNAAGTALDYAGYIGGVDSDSGNGVAADAGGNAYVAGYTHSREATFPVTIGPDLTFNSVTSPDAFVAKVNAAGTGLVYAGYIGGSGDNQGHGIGVDAGGNAYVTGQTYSTETTFPVTIGPDLTYNGCCADAFVAKVSADGSALVYAGYVGGFGTDSGFGMAVDGSGSAFLTGITDATEASFPVTVGPDLTYNGSGDDDAFVAKVDSAGTGLVYAGYIGGADIDYGRGIALDTAGDAYVTGATASSETTFPVTVGPDRTFGGGAFDAFVARVMASGTGLVYAGYIGGDGDDRPGGIAVDSLSNAYVTGMTPSTESTFPVTVGPDLTFNGGSSDAFVVEVNAAGTGLIYAGYIGGGVLDEGGAAIAVDSAAGVYVVGRTVSDETTFPVVVGPDLTLNNSYDVFVAKIYSSPTVFTLWSASCVGPDVQLDWTATRTPNTTGYEIGRAASPAGPFTPPLAVLGPSTFTYSDPGAASGNYWYRLTEATTAPAGDQTPAFATTVCAGPPTFAVTGAASNAACALGGAGGANGEVEPGEDAETTPIVQNTSPTSATNVRATVTSPTPGILITQGALAFGDLPPGQSWPGSPPIAYSVGPGFTCGTLIQLDLAITSDQGAGSGSCSVLVPSSCDRCLPTPCSLTVPACSVNPCLGGCPGNVTVGHETLSPCNGGGGFDLTGTRYESTCAGGGAGCTVDVPPLRFWAYDSFEGANSGCEPLSLLNPGFDPGPNGPPGHWVVNTSWSLPRIDGCVNSSAVRRTVAELSFPTLASEGTVDHSSRYLVLAVPEARPEAYDLDAANGSTTGCDPKDLATAPVPPPTIPGRTGSCTASNEVLEADPGGEFFMKAVVALTPPSPAWFSETGADGGPPLVAGYQVLYALGPREPLTSDALTGGWLPVYDPGDPSLRMGVLPLGLAQPQVSIPLGQPGDRAWLATRVVYQDRDTNPLGTFDVASAGPLVVSDVSSHCGPLARPRLADSSTQYAQASVAPGGPVTLLVDVRNTADSAIPGLIQADAIDVVVRIEFDPCVDVSGFDPATIPAQVEVLYHDSTTTSRSFAHDTQWLPTPDPPTLIVTFLEPLPAVPQPPARDAFPFVAIAITGVDAGPATTPACCTVAEISHGNNPNFLPQSACFAITNCAPMPMTGLTVLKRPRGAVELAWDPVSNPGATIGINVWKLLGGDPSLLARANAASAPSIPASILRRVCQGAPGDTSCLDLEITPGSLAFYQARAVCLDGTESP